MQNDFFDGIYTLYICMYIYSYITHIMSDVKNMKWEVRWNGIRVLFLVNQDNFNIYVLNTPIFIFLSPCHSV